MLWLVGIYNQTNNVTEVHFGNRNIKQTFPVNWKPCLPKLAGGGMVCSEIV